MEGANTASDDTSASAAAPRGGQRTSSQGWSAEAVTAIGDLVYRRRARVVGTVKGTQLQSWAGVESLDCTLVDGTGAIDVVFLGRRTVGGLVAGARLGIEGMVGKHDGLLAIINPAYELL
ncbi:MAG: OB-fold nucleic acid binding domain-containing protein [Acidimicrobiales bacterium]